MEEFLSIPKEIIGWIVFECILRNVFNLITQKIKDFMIDAYQNIIVLGFFKTLLNRVFSNNIIEKMNLNKISKQ